MDSNQEEKVDLNRGRGFFYKIFQKVNRVRVKFPENSEKYINAKTEHIVARQAIPIIRVFREERQGAIRILRRCEGWREVLCSESVTDNDLYVVFGNPGSDYQENVS